MSVIAVLLGEVGARQESIEKLAAWLTYAWVNNRDCVSNTVQDEVDTWGCPLTPPPHTPGHMRTLVHRPGNCAPPSRPLFPYLKCKCFDFAFEVLRFEPSPFCMRGQCSTVELYPHQRHPQTLLAEISMEASVWIQRLTMFLWRLSKLPHKAPPRKRIHSVQLL